MYEYVYITTNVLCKLLVLHIKTRENIIFKYFFSFQNSQVIYIMCNKLIYEYPYCIRKIQNKNPLNRKYYISTIMLLSFFF